MYGEKARWSISYGEKARELGAIGLFSQQTKNWLRFNGLPRCTFRKYVRTERPRPDNKLIKANRIL